MSSKPTIKIRAGSNFSFGDPEPVLNNNLTDYLGIFTHNGEYYTPPVSLTGLVKCSRANPHHASALYFKRNMATKWFIPSPYLSQKSLSRAAYDYHWAGQCYFRARYNTFGQFLYFEHLPALYIRKLAPKNGQFNRYGMLTSGGKLMPFLNDEVVQLKNYDPTQGIYGTPEYLAGLQSMLLNEDATLFRRRYYKNGAHMGYVFLNTSGEMSEEDEDLLSKEIGSSKGVGNFRSMFLSLPGADADSVKILPVGDISTKDEFERVKNITRNDVLAMHRINPALSGVMPDNDAGYGDIEKIGRVNYENEVVPIQQVFLQLNDYLPAGKMIAFKEPETAIAAE
ncbi:phage portal protein, PBSX family [Paraglaciecola sp. T6c]|uniref:phage portal protein n=1 Tax=Pseudoalteromonas atlantica (strain T6c / ATCC BAA-1087) TaxID=3042615 RepID=UPI00005C6263|nr:phage portal protein [Paraglaciecola sp. T6c]ABG39222.1 phage portal protein, PBSX family [Paraglaciecola sp. T6c]